MKKRIKTLLLIFIVLIFAFTLNVYAEDKACKITINADKSKLNVGDTVTLTLTMSDITLSNGIGTFLSQFEYDENIFELVTEDNPELKSALSEVDEIAAFDKFDILYAGDANSSTINPWFILYFESRNEKAAYGSIMKAAQNSTQEIGKIKLKVKSNATAGNTKVQLLSTTVVDAESILNENSTNATQYEIEDSSVNLTINQSSSSSSSSSSSTTNSNKQNSSTQSSTSQNTQKNSAAVQANGSAPNTGVEDYIPYAVVIIAIGLISYVNYKKYKDIY